MQTLISDDMIDYEVHKFVLSACSPVFKEILLNNQNEHPTIYLNGVKNQELQYLLQLLYYGRANMLYEHVPKLFAIFEDLKITGFSLPNRMRKLEDSKFEGTSEDDSHKATYTRRVHRLNRRERIKSNRVALIDEEQKQVYNCEDCEATFTTRKGLKCHWECVHEGIRYECDRCDYKARKKDHLVIHKESIHEGIRYECDQCNYKATTKSDLRRHQRNTRSCKV